MGLTVETLLLGIPGVVYLAALSVGGGGTFGRGGLGTDLLFMGAALATAFPSWLSFGPRSMAT